MSDALCQQAVDAVVRLALEPAPSTPDQIETEFRALRSLLIDLVHQPKREPVEAFFEATRRAVFRIETTLSAVKDEPRDTAWYCLGQLTNLAETAQTLLSQKVPEPALRVLIRSQVAYEIANTLRDEGSKRVIDLASRLGKSAQNLTPVLREMTAAGLIRREEIGRTVRLWPTPLTTAALDCFSDPTVISSAAKAVAASVRQVPGDARPAVLPVETRAGGAAEPSLASRMRNYILERSATVRNPTDPLLQLRAAHKSAKEFLALFAPPAESVNHDARWDVQRRNDIINNLSESSDYFLRDEEIRLFGSEPGLYVPGVFQSNDRGQITIRVSDFLNADGRFPELGLSPGPIATGVRLLLEGRSTARSGWNL